MKKYLLPFSFIFILLILIAAVIPEGCLYGSNTDWLSQHITLAETIRDACVEQKTLLPSWISLGSGSVTTGVNYVLYILLLIFISRIRLAPFLSKIIVSAVTVTGNYILCKYSIFKKEETSGILPSDSSGCRRN